ncbi:MAG: energy-coupling factor transporter transmembrane component T [Bacillota bacterium]|nr:energy-coupling factor transporter transmembrane component T [Bacillota bacterium]
MKFNSYHPTINLIYFASAIGFTIRFNHPIFLVISYMAAFAYSVKLKGLKSLVFNLCLVPLIILYAIWYSYYNHFGVTGLRRNFAGNEITLEAIVFGLVIGITAAAVVMWMSCVFEVFSSDKLVYLFGRVSPKLSLFFSILLRSVPRIKQTTVKINLARSGMGRGSRQGNILCRLRNCLSIFSMVITWTMESFILSSRSMRSRGYSLKGRTAFSIYRFDNRDRGFVIAIFLCLTLMMMAIMLNQVTIHYDPMIIMNRITRVSYVFYIAYGVFLLMPMGLQIVGEAAFKRRCRQRWK